MDRESDEEILGNLTAGPLEDLLSRHGEALIERVEQEARSDAKCRSVLRGLYDSGIPSKRAVKRPWWAVALAGFCAGTTVFLVSRDLFVPQVRDTEVWFGFEVHGLAALLSAPLHWLLFSLGAWGFWYMRPWVWPWASIYAFYIAASHLVWNLTSSSGGGLTPGLWQLVVFSVPAFVLFWARPARVTI